MRNSVGGSGVAVMVWRKGTCAGLFATLLLIPAYAAANPSGKAPAVAAAFNSTSSSDSAGAAPIWIVKMNDDDPMYRPSTVEISAGQTVEWENDGQVSHSVTDDPARADKPGDALLPAGVKPFNSGNVMPGGRFRHTFTQPGRYRYFCMTHEGDKMIGEVIVEPPAPPPQVQIAKSNQRTLPSKSGPGVSLRVVKMHDDQPRYRPSSIRIVSGQTVEWENDGQVSYSVSDDPARAWDPVDALRPSGVRPFNSGSILPGGRFRHTFTEPGRYRYFCPTHEVDRMVGEVIVEPAGNPEASQSTPSVDGLSAATHPAVAE